MASWCVTRTLRSYLNAARINTCRNGIRLCEASSSFFTSTPPGKKSKRLLYSKSLCGLVHEASCGNRVDEELTRILNAQTIERVFENLFLSDTLTPQLITAAFTTLEDLLTKQLLSFSWGIHNRYPLIYFQSFFSSETRELYKQINDNSEFKRLCSEANKFRQDFTNGQLLAVTQSVLKLLNLNTNDSTFFGLFIECQRRQDEFDWEELSAYSTVSHMMRRNGFYVNAYICERFERLRPQLGQDMVNKSFQNLENLIHCTVYFMTDEKLNELQEWLCELATNNQELNFSWFLLIFDSVRRFSSSINPKLLILMYNHLENNFEEATAEDLFRIGMFRKDYNSCPQSIILKMKNRADRLLLQREELKTSDVIFLTSAYDSLRYPGDSLEVLEDVLIPKIEEMDIILLKYLSSKSNIMLSTQRSDFLESFFNQILKLKMEIFGSPSCLVSIVNCLCKILKTRRNRSFEQKFSRQLMFYIMSRHLEPSYLLNIARFLTQCLDYFDTQTIERFHEKLLNIIPNISLNDVLYTASGFPNVEKRYDYTPSFAKYQPEHYPSVLLSSLAQQAMIRKDELKNLNQVNQWVSILNKSNASFIRQNNKQVCEMYARHAETLDSISIPYACTFLKRFRLNVPEVLDRISSTLLSSSSFLNLTDVTKSIELLAYFNYNCNDIEELGELYLDKVNQLGNEWEGYVGVIVSGANHLATLQNYSEKLLSFIFSLDFLRQLDETIENDPNKSRKEHVKRMFLELNRSVLLQCPHIPVPWISRSFTWKNEFITKSWQISIYEGLLHLLGGVDYVKVGPLTTECSHLYDYECALDINHIPVPVDSPKTHYRIAVLLLKPNNFSANDNKLTGPAIDLITQLEILGFTVIKVPYFDLEQFKKISVQSRRQYFKKLLFSKETRTSQFNSN